MVNNSSQSDVIFKLDSKTFHAHRYVLCSASDVFRNLFDVSEKVKAKSLTTCLGWTKRRLGKATKENVNAGLMEGFIHMEKKYDQCCVYAN